MEMEGMTVQQKQGSPAATKLKVSWSPVPASQGDEEVLHHNVGAMQAKAAVQHNECPDPEGSLRRSPMKMEGMTAQLTKGTPTAGQAVEARELSLRAAARRTGSNRTYVSI